MRDGILSVNEGRYPNFTIMRPRKSGLCGLVYIALNRKLKWYRVWS